MKDGFIFGCRKWFNVVRDIQQIYLKIYKLSENRPEINEFQNPLKSPSANLKLVQKFCSEKIVYASKRK